MPVTEYLVKSRSRQVVVSLRARLLRFVRSCMLGLVASSMMPAQEAPPPVESTKEETAQNAAASCMEPPPLARWQDYDGPFQKLVGTFGRKLDRKTAHAPHYKPGAMLCSLELGDKFRLFVGDTLDPFSFLSAGFNAGLDQAAGSDPSYGQGAAGFGKRFGAEYAGLAASNFFSGFVYPAIFSEDPRYYRLAHGNAGRRLLHAVEHSVVARRDSGRRMFNFSEWLGTSTTVVLSNTYHPDNVRTFAPTARAVGYSVLSDVGFDVFREFWPEIARYFHMPFRDFHEVARR